MAEKVRDDELDSLREQLEKHAQERSETERQTRALMLRKAAAEKIILDLSKKHLDRAAGHGMTSAQQALIDQFIMGAQGGELISAFGAYAIISGFGMRTALRDRNNHILAVRVEQNPAFPVFLVAKGVGPVTFFEPIMEVLQDGLIKYMRAYATTTPDFLSDFWRRP